MTDFIYYPQSNNQTLSNIANDTCRNEAEQQDHLSALINANPRIASAAAPMSNRKPIIIPNGAASCGASQILNCTPQEHETLHTLSYALGGAGVMTLANLVWETKLPESIGYLNTFGGAGIGAGQSASNFILKDVANYDRLLAEYEDLKNHRGPNNTGPKHRMLAKKAELDRAFQRMNNTLNRKGQAILHKNAFKTRETLNKTGRVVRESIPVSSVPEVKQLASFAKHAKILGPGAILIDGYFRANQVNHLYKNNDPAWKRAAFVQGASFAAGIGAGLVIGAIFAPALGGIILTVAMAGTAGIIMDKLAQTLAENTYDYAF